MRRTRSIERGYLCGMIRGDGIDRQLRLRASGPDRQLRPPIPAGIGRCRGARSVARLPRVRRGPHRCVRFLRGQRPAPADTCDQESVARWRRPGPRPDRVASRSERRLVSRLPRRDLRCGGELQRLAADRERRPGDDRPNGRRASVGSVSHTRWRARTRSASATSVCWEVYGSNSDCSVGSIRPSAANGRSPAIAIKSHGQARRSLDRAARQGDRDVRHHHRHR